MQEKAKKNCYGILEKVFPVGERGLREIVPSCFQCAERTPCLKAALSTRDGLEMRGKIIERSEFGGLIGRLQRWSQKKDLSRLMKMENKKAK